MAAPWPVLSTHAVRREAHGLAVDQIYEVQQAEAGGRATGHVNAHTGAT